MRKLAIVAGLALVPALAITAWAWERELGEALGGTDSNRKYSAVSRLDPSDSRALRAIVRVLEREEWHVRRGAIAALSGTPASAIDEVNRHLQRGSPLVKEGILLAYGRSGDHDRIPDIIGALGDRQFMVKRAAVRALSELHDARSVPALLDAWKDERDARLQYYYHEALKTITGEEMGPVIADWQNWWKAVEDGFVPPSQRGDGEEAGGSGQSERGSTVLRDVELSFTESGRGGPLFVMPKYGYNNDYMFPAMKALEDVCRVFYIDLPEINRFENLPPVGATGMPYYPIDQLCDAFDELRQQRNEDRIAILGHGMTTWVAMRYATLYPEHVSHVILVSPWTSGAAWGQGRERVERDGSERGDVEQERYAQSLTINPQTGERGYAPSGQDEAMALRRKGLTTNFADRRDGSALLMYPDIFRDMGGVLIPQFDVGQEEVNTRVPTLIIYGARSLWTDSNDMRQLNRYFRQANQVQAPSSAMFPMIEDYELFQRTLRAFFRRHRFR